MLENRVPQHVPDFKIPRMVLDFVLLPLYPSDFLSLAYYARIKVRSMKMESQLSIALGLCSITDVGLYCLFEKLIHRSLRLINIDATHR